MNLYLCKNVSEDEFFVVAQHPTEAQEVLETVLHEAGYDAPTNREVKEIFILTKGIAFNANSRPKVTINTRLIIVEEYIKSKMKKPEEGKANA